MRTDVDGRAPMVARDSPSFQVRLQDQPHISSDQLPVEINPLPATNPKEGTDSVAAASDFEVFDRAHMNSIHHQLPNFSAL